MNLTNYHAKHFAYELTKRSPSDSVEKLASMLADAQVDLNPHQVETALFAFRSPFLKGAILADEAGLGKTIEAGLLIAIYLPSVILETRSFNEAIRAFDQASREIDRQKDSLLDEIGRRLEQKVEEERLFTIRWRLT